MLRHTAKLIPLLVLLAFDFPAIAACTDAVAANSSGVVELGFAFGATSDASYGSPACPGRFVIEADVTKLKGSGETNAGADWGDKAVPQQSCAFALISASFYGFLPATGNRRGGSWVDLGTKSSGGKWMKVLDAGTCGIDVGVAVDTTKFTKVRVAGKASTSFGGVKKIHAYVSNLQPPR